MNAEKCKGCLKVIPQANCASTALLFLRLVVGAAFIIHGYGKIQNPMAWMGPDAPVPGVFQLLAAVSEFFGGMGLVVGLLTPLAAFGISCTMAVAVCTHMFMMKDPFVNPTGGRAYELALVYLAVAVLIMTMGPGKWSIDAKVFGNKK